jgi:lipopolysaccharide biosynthesis glycosyltransferase
MILNVAYSSSDLYSKFAGISIISLFENNSEFDNINIYFIEDNVSEENKNKLKEIVSKYNGNIHFMSFDIISGEMKGDNRNFAKSTYGKLFLYKLNDVDRIVYIDCDTIIQRSLKELWEINIEHYIIGGVLDCVYPYEKEIIHMKKNDNYINCGVLLMNLDAWRKNNITQKCIQYLEDNNYLTPNYDQGLINCICHNNTLIIDPKFNMMSHVFTYSRDNVISLFKLNEYYTDEVLKKAKESPVIIHYLEHFYGKPWYVDSSHPYKDIFIDCWRTSPWEIKLNKSQQKKRLKIRRFIYMNFKFTIYMYVEKVLNLRRNYIVKRIYRI